MPDSLLKQGERHPSIRYCATCGHPIGDHGYGGALWPAAPHYGHGPCHDGDCDCEQFINDSEHKA